MSWPTFLFVNKNVEIIIVTAIIITFGSSAFIAAFAWGWISSNNTRSNSYIRKIYVKI